jgi:hypothetical protein
MTKLKVAFRNFANTPHTYNFPRVHKSMKFGFVLCTTRLPTVYSVMYKKILLTRSLLSKFHTASRCTSKSNLIYSPKDSEASPRRKFTKPVNGRTPLRTDPLHRNSTISESQGGKYESKLIYAPK